MKLLCRLERGVAPLLVADVMISLSSSRGLDNQECVGGGEGGAFSGRT